MSLHNIPSYSTELNSVENYAISLKDIELHPAENNFVYRGYQCSINLSNRNTWNGYVEIDTFHVCYNLDHKDTLEERDEFYLEAHGGLSYSYTTDTKTILGFHTCHIGDFIPDHKIEDVDFNFNYSSYRTYDYVMNHVVKLVDQLYFYQENVENISFLFRN